MFPAVVCWVYYQGTMFLNSSVVTLIVVFWILVPCLSCYWFRRPSDMIRRFKHSVFVSRSEAKWLIRLAAGVCFYCGYLHHNTAFENRHQTGGDKSSKVERQRITTHACPHAHTHTHDQGLENNALHDCTNRTRTIKCIGHCFHLLFYHFITTMINFYHMTTCIVFTTYFYLVG